MAPTARRVTEQGFQVRLPAPLHRDLKKQAEREDRPMSRIIRAALREYLEARSA